jgi:agmatinase
MLLTADATRGESSEGREAASRFLEGELELPTYEAARVAILPVPYEASVTYGRGTAHGPAAILRASPYLELHDEQTGTAPHRSGIFTDCALECSGLRPEQVVQSVARRFGELLDDGKWVVMLGGEHSITPGAVRATARRFENLHVVQLDAHADLRETYQGDRWNHACAMARCVERARVHAVGIRSYSEGEARRIKQGIRGYRVTHAWELEREGWIEIALDGLAGKPVYLTIDVDYFDPAIMPATGTPEPGGGHWWPTMRFLEKLFQVASVVACDVVELAPVKGLHHADFTAARLVYKLIGFAVSAGTLER